MRITRSIALVAGLTAALTFAAAPAALAGNDDVSRQGSCSAASDWDLKVGTDDGQLDGEFEVDQNVSGQTWRVRIVRNGIEIFRGRRTTEGSSGSFEVDFRAANLAGDDAVRARAVNVSSGETCVGRVVFTG